MLESIEVKPLTAQCSEAVTWRVPGSKSITNRVLILAALTSGKTILNGVLHSDDTRHMTNALRAMGINIEKKEDGSVVVEGGVDKLKEPADGKELFIGNSGTTVRFLTTFTTLVPGTVTLNGDEHMAKRPIADLVSALKQMNISIDCPTDCPPIKIAGGNDGLPGGNVEMNGTKSSQYFSSLMLSGAYAKTDLKINIKGTLVSLPYVTMTKKCVEDFGGKIDLDMESNCITVHPTAYALPNNGSYAIEPDASAASYPFAAAAATGLKIRVPILNESSIQGDYGFVDILEKMGCKVEKDQDGTTVTGPEQGVKLKGVDVDMHHISDTVMTLAAIAPLCDGPTTIRNVANIRIKETDRLIATVNELKRLGQEVEYGDDWLKIVPKPVQPAKIECYADHRMAMAFGILGLAVPGVTITDKKCTGKTYPGFWDDMNSFCEEVKAASVQVKKPKLTV